MVIDFHTHAFPDQIARRAIDSLCENSGHLFEPCHNGTLGGLIDNMKKFGVDISVVQPVITKPSQTETLNLWAAEITRQNENIISFGGIHPHTDDYKRDIDFVCSLGLLGLKFHCEYQDFKIDDPLMLKIYDYAFSRGLIILHHAGFDPAFPAPYRSSPKMFASVSKQMQGGIMIAAHFGGGRQWDEVEQFLVGTNIYLDTSMGQEYYSNEQFTRIVSAHGADKILFGSDSPWSRADLEISSIENSPLNDDEKALIFHKNAEKLLNLTL